MIHVQLYVFMRCLYLVLSWDDSISLVFWLTVWKGHLVPVTLLTVHLCISGDDKDEGIDQFALIECQTKNLTNMIYLVIAITIYLIL